MIVYANSLGFIESGEGPATLGEVSAPHPFSWMSETIDLRKEKHFFETRITEYQSASTLQWD
jgi:ribonucleotide reductase beta subunit family protein with ferritin-like domain